MNRSGMVAIADAACVGRPDWQQAGTISQIQVLAHTWQGSDAQLAAHVLAVAADPNSRTPAAINATPPTRARSKQSGSREPQCYICGRSKSDCQRVNDIERSYERDVDPHTFETAEEADANTGKVQFDPHQLALAAMPRINEYEESDERKAAKARAREAIAEARRKIAWKPDQLPEPRRIQEPQPDQPDPQPEPQQEAQPA